MRRRDVGRRVELLPTLIVLRDRCHHAGNGGRLIIWVARSVRGSWLARVLRRAWVAGIAANRAGLPLTAHGLHGLAALVAAQGLQGLAALVAALGLHGLAAAAQGALRQSGSGRPGGAAGDPSRPRRTLAPADLYGRACRCTPDRCAGGGRSVLSQSTRPLATVVASAAPALLLWTSTIGYGCLTDWVSMSLMASASAPRWSASRRSHSRACRCRWPLS